MFKKEKDFKDFSDELFILSYKDGFLTFVGVADNFSYSPPPRPSSYFPQHWPVDMHVNEDAM